jgi:hypothetical protein
MRVGEIISFEVGLKVTASWQRGRNTHPAEPDI